MAKNNQNPKVVWDALLRMVPFSFWPGQCENVQPANKEVSAGAMSPPEKQGVSEGSGEPGDAYVITFLESIFFPLTKKQETCALYCEQFPRFFRLLSGLHNEGHGAAEFPSYHKLACTAPLLSPQSSSNCCN